MCLQSVLSYSPKYYHYNGWDNRKYNKLKSLHNVTKPNQAWVSDTTEYYYDPNSKAYYICIFLDLFSLKIVSYAIGTGKNTYLTKRTFLKAYNNRKPEPGLICHSDRGAEYTSRYLSEVMKQCGCIQSFSSPHCPNDNPVAESFFRTLKRECLYRSNFRSEREFFKTVDEFMNHYNSFRPHESFAYKTPNEVENKYNFKHNP